MHFVGDFVRFLHADCLPLDGRLCCWRLVDVPVTRDGVHPAEASRRDDVCRGVILVIWRHLRHRNWLGNLLRDARLEMVFGCMRVAFMARRHFDVLDSRITKVGCDSYSIWLIHCIQSMQMAAEQWRLR